MKLDAMTLDVQSILKNDCFYEIPDYQRPYSWTKVQINELFDDIDEGIEHGSNHFLGTIMVNTSREKKEKVIEVIDGQQRITTIIMILYVLVEIYNTQRFIKQPKIEARISKLIDKLANTNDDGDIVSDKLILGEVNRNFFKDFIIDGLNNPTKKDCVLKTYKDNNKLSVNKSIIDAYKTIKDNFYNKINGLSDSEAFSILKDYQSYILERLEIVKIAIEEDADAFLIFETLNDRGLALSSIDLVKNKLFKNCAAKDDFEEIKNKWIDMINQIEDIKDIKKYLRHYWMAKYGYVSNQNLFKELRDTVGNSYSKSKEIVEELNDLSKYYAALKYPFNGVIEHKNLKNTLDEMHKLNYDLIYPILIAAFRKFKDEQQIYIISKLCLNFLIRYISVMGEKPSSVEKKISELAVNLDINNLEVEFNNLAPDSRFKLKLDTLEVNYKSYLAYYLLVEYEKSKHINEPWVTPGRETVTIEHILPQTVSEETVYGQQWIDVFDGIENCKNYLNRLGNLSLLGNTPQSKSKNREFNFKKSIYKEFTDMKSTKELLDYKEWTIDNINDRQSKMADVINKRITLNSKRI